MVNAMFPLALQGVTVARRGRPVLGPVDLVLGQGGPTMILGPNGSGKTTLLRVMHGLERIGAGSVGWQRDAPDRRAFVFQTPVMLRRSTIENLCYPLRLRGVGRADARQAAAGWLARIGLSDHAHRPATRLSGGERQKLALARALIGQPDAVFLDEPCSNLDGHATREIETLLRAAAQSGTRIVMATHDMGQARRLAADVVFLVAGRIVETGAAPAIFAAPKTPAFRAFLNGDIVT
ncbi:MAG: ATP-binding cassette domain-containing protein [Rhodobacteraceae bacterium]|nr:ATP-binding cassette domain-containing protein [Paracoccaceae bacterium]